MGWKPCTERSGAPDFVVGGLVYQVALLGKAGSELGAMGGRGWMERAGRDDCSQIGLCTRTKATSLA